MEVAASPSTPTVACALPVCWWLSFSRCVLSGWQAHGCSASWPVLFSWTVIPRCRSPRSGTRSFTRSCVQRQTPMVQTAYNCGVSAVVVLFVRRHPCRGADADSHGPSSQSFLSCSTLIRWSTFAVQVVACPLCATTDAVVDDVAQFIDSFGRPCDPC